MSVSEAGIDERKNFFDRLLEFENIDFSENDFTQYEEDPRLIEAAIKLKALDRRKDKIE